MITGLSSYLGWEEPQHKKGCKRSGWDVHYRTEDHQYRSTGYGEEQPQHKCADEDCDHGTGFSRLIVRHVCKGCGAALVISAEKTPETRVEETSTRVLGYGLPPRQVAGLLLWPAHPWLRIGMLDAEEPHDFVVTRLKVREVTPETVVGQLTLGRGKLNGLVWTALAVPSADGGRYGLGQVRFVHANDGRGGGGKPLRTVNAAARWIAARLAEQPETAGAA
ncbi:hypothetical protein [Streptomyces fuscichromogenes]|uniref:Uncharacterized protein n=1 Tax=Streptomyces fuscichromogenes TaxID=1324013 RepID=A0A917XQ98_9ACTN|nr:hypothetical protein [Streptomyces fuscichromogenes]GGN47237.1 hypothetical protein GCM10011578_100720 [Streptomyces fuscichromogenes]